MVVGLAMAFHFGLATIWLWAAWYVATFLGFHVVMVPFMTAWHAGKRAVASYIRATIEEEMIRADLQNYEKQLRRVFPGRSDRS